MKRLIHNLGWLSCFALLGAVAWSQDPLPQRYFPYPHPTPPGMAGDWAAKAGRGHPGTLQLVEVRLPCEGKVTFYQKGVDTGVEAAGPARASVLVGPVYRLKISELADFPGVELYPTIELMDRLHPPADRVNDFPVPIEISAEEMEYAIHGQMVTKAIYLEQPNRASRAQAKGNNLPSLIVRPTDNPLELADHLGRPMALLRLGGRTPDPHHPEPGFYGTGAPIAVQATK